MSKARENYIKYREFMKTDFGTTRTSADDYIKELEQEKKEMLEFIGEVYKTIREGDAVELDDSDFKYVIEKIKGKPIDEVLKDE